MTTQVSTPSTAQNIWNSIQNGASTVSNAVVAGAKKVGQYAMTAFQFIATYAGKAWDGLCTLGGKAYSAGSSGVALAKDNPYVAGGIVAGVAAIGVGYLLYNRCCGASA
jgi:hypothetical protein